MAARGWRGTHRQQSPDGIVRRPHKGNDTDHPTDSDDGYESVLPPLLQHTT